MSTGAAVFDHLVKNIEQSSELDRALAAILRDLLEEGKRPVIRRRTRRARKTTKQKARAFLESTDHGYVTKKTGRVKLTPEQRSESQRQGARTKMEKYTERVEVYREQQRVQETESAKAIAAMKAYSARAKAERDAAKQQK